MSHPGRLEGKTAIITGSGMGLGEGITRKFVEQGANVLLFEISEEHGQKVAESLPKEKAAYYKGDVTNLEHWEGALKASLDRFGGLVYGPRVGMAGMRDVLTSLLMHLQDIVVNNAGVVHRAGVRGHHVANPTAQLTTPIALSRSPAKRVRSHHVHQCLATLPQRQSHPPSFRQAETRRLRQHIFHLRTSPSSEPRLVRW